MRGSPAQSWCTPRASYATRLSSIVPVAFPATLSLKDEKIQIEFVEKGDEIKLLVKKEWVKEGKTPEPKREEE